MEPASVDARTLPNFVVVGAARAGTTSLYDWLAQHPQVYMSPLKETNLFSAISKAFRGPGDVRFVTTDEVRYIVSSFSPTRGRHFRGAGIVSSMQDYEMLFLPGRSYKARGEISPSYLYYRAASQNIKNVLPHMRIVIILRNPADRLYSNWRALVAAGRESEDIETAIRLEERRLSDGWEFFWALRGLSRYAERVERYLVAFPSDQVRIWLYERIMRDPQQFYSELAQFLGIEGNPHVVFSRLNGTADARRWPRGIRSIGKLPLIRTTWRKLAPRWRRLIGYAVSRPIRPFSRDLRARLLREFEADIRRLDRLVPELRAADEWLSGS